MSFLCFRVTCSLLDLCSLLGSLVNESNGEILVKNFYDNVAEVSKDESALYSQIEERSGHSALELAKRWRQPAISVHSIQTSSYNDTVIPRKYVVAFEPVVCQRSNLTIC